MSFMVGVATLCVTEFVALKFPEVFGYYYFCAYIFLMGLRVYGYRKQRTSAVSLSVSKTNVQDFRPLL